MLMYLFKTHLKNTGNGKAVRNSPGLLSAGLAVGFSTRTQQRSREKSLYRVLLNAQTRIEPVNLAQNR